MNKIKELMIILAPGMGHLMPMLQLAKLLLKNNESISICIPIIRLLTHSSKISAYIESQTRNNPYPTRLTFITLPPLTILPDPSSSNFFFENIEYHKPVIRQLVEGRVRDGSPKLVGFVLDMFCTTMVDVANDMGVPSYVFFVSGASFLNFIFYAGSLADELGFQAHDLAALLSVPEVPFPVTGFKNQLTSKNIPGSFKDRIGGGMILNLAKQFKRLKGILINTYMELESYGIHELQDTRDKQIPRVYPVGPIMEFKRGDGSEDEEKDLIIKWLDDQPTSSVVFLCFGTMGRFNEEQVKEIANGVEKSGHRFLWSLRRPPPVGQPDAPGAGTETFLEALPEGFMDRMAGTGMVIGWAPQVDILAHPGIGGFVSHCGWNSILESLWFGVPTGAWPMYAEQQLNAFELVKELELGVEIRIDYIMDWSFDTSFFVVKANEIEEGINKLMSTDENMRKNVKEMSEGGRKALEEGGSSNRWLKRFIEDLMDQ